MTNEWIWWYCEFVILRPYISEAVSIYKNFTWAFCCCCWFCRSKSGFCCLRGCDFRDKKMLNILYGHIIIVLQYDIFSLNIKVPFFLYEIAPSCIVPNSTLQPTHHLFHMPENATQCSFLAHSVLHFLSFAFLSRKSKIRWERSWSPHFLLLFLGSGMIPMSTISSYNRIIQGHVFLLRYDLFLKVEKVVLMYLASSLSL